MFTHSSPSICIIKYTIHDSFSLICRGFPGPPNNIYQQFKQVTNAIKAIIRYGTPAADLIIKSFAYCTKVDCKGGSHGNPD
jgi:hypothetical protein